MTRELLVEKPNENNIDTETREMLSEIGKSKAHNIDNIIDKFKELEPSQIKEGFNILLPVSYTHLDVYKRQKLLSFQNRN